jgi:polyisoprenoid-binding protein YceI
MKKYILILSLTLGITSTIYSQDKYFTRTGTLSFYSETPIENIEAENNQASAILDIQTGEIAVSAQMIGFEFEKALMQEHFNENYIESDKFPKATFKGKILNYSGAPDDSETTEVTVEGVLTLHGVSKDISTTGTLSKA